MKTLLKTLLFLLILGAIGGAVYWRIGTKKAETENQAGAPKPSGDGVGVASAEEFSTALPIAVEGVPVIKDELVLKVSASGQAAALRKAILTSRVNGRLAGVRVRESGNVAEGAILLEIDPTELKMDVDNAAAGLARAKRTFEELTLGDDRIPDAAVRESRTKAAREKAGIDGAEIALKRAELNLSYAKVTAPFGGRIADLKVVPGQWIRAGDELLTILEMNPIKVELDVLEADIGQVEPGRSASLVFSALPDRTFKGTIQTINPLVDPLKSRTSRVTVLVPNPDGRILPGFYAKATLDAKRLPGRILVPRQAVVERDKRTLVFLFEGNGDTGTAMWQYVRTGIDNGTYVEIIEDPEDSQTRLLKPGEIVLVDGHLTLTHGAAVRLVSNTAAEGGRPR
jgi:RND family efflux transporter MFP subunit